jgi:quinoprotein glucose dehydrogenase
MCARETGLAISHGAASGQFGHDSWQGESWQDRGGANAWGGLSVDDKRGIVFAGARFSLIRLYGGDRPGQNLFANCVIALDARNGQRIWHFQTLHHDLWDHDLPTYPNLVTVTRDGRPVDAAAQVTKTGFVFLLDRVTGRPLFDVVEREVPRSDVPGEQAWPTQPFPVKPPPFAAQEVTEENVTDIGPRNREDVLRQLQQLRGGPAFNPPSLQGTISILVSWRRTWAGASFDPGTCILTSIRTTCPTS